MRRRFSSHMAMAQHGGSWGFMGHARLTPIQPSCGCHQHWPAATIFQDLPSLEHDTVGRMWHVHFTMAVHTVVALHHPDWILSNYLFVSKKWNKSWENLHISLQTSKMLVWHPTIHWKQIPRRPSEKKNKKHPLSGSACQTVCNRIHLCSACPRTSWELWRKIMQRSDGWSHCHPAWLAVDLRWFCSIPSDISLLCDQTRTSLPGLPHDIS